MHDCEDKDAVLLHNGSMGMQGFMLGSSGMQAGVFTVAWLPHGGSSVVLCTKAFLEQLIQLMCTVVSFFFKNTPVIKDSLLH